MRFFIDASTRVPYNFLRQAIDEDEDTVIYKEYKNYAELRSAIFPTFFFKGVVKR